MMRKRLNSRGDTIVEVLIAIGVVSLVLGAAYVSASRSGQAIRTAQERGEALKVAESQLEQVKAALISRTPTIPNSPSTFCIESGVVNASGSPCAITQPGQLTYDTKIDHHGNTFTVNVQWDHIGGGPANMLELDYIAQ